MKKLISAVTLSIICAFSSLSAASADKPVYAALGDSITTGYGLNEPENSFAQRLSTDFGFGLNNMAQNGATSADLLAALSDEEFSQAVRNAGLISVSIGGNDVLSILTEIFFKALSETEINLDGGVSNLISAAEDALKSISQKIGSEENLTRLYTAAHSFAQNYDDIMLRLKALNPDAKLYVQTLYNPFGGIPAFREFNELAEAIVAEINAPIYGGAEKYGYTIIDTYRNFKGKTLIRTNIVSLDIHPSRSGHNAIYELMKAAVGNDGFELCT